MGSVEKRKKGRCNENKSRCCWSKEEGWKKGVKKRKEQRREEREGKRHKQEGCKEQGRMVSLFFPLSSSRQLVL
jgi:hypothetical protein